MRYQQSSVTRFLFHSAQCNSIKSHSGSIHFNEAHTIQCKSQNISTSLDILLVIIFTILILIDRQNFVIFSAQYIIHLWPDLDNQLCALVHLCILYAQLVLQLGDNMSALTYIFFAVMLEVGIQTYMCMNRSVSCEMWPLSILQR